MTTTPISLKLAKGLHLELSRIGYAEEGLRLTVFDQIPYNFHVEVQLSRSDAVALVSYLQAHIANPRNDNLPP
jgi:hypothetical protein